MQPPLGEDQWTSSPWELVERDGRWYGRGSADCKGNIVMHLTALRALGGELPCHVKLIVEGSEEQGTGGLEQFVPQNVELLRADTILVVDTGNFAVGVPTLTTTLRGMTTEGQGGSIPLCNVFADTYPDAEIMLLGVEEPQCLIHAPNGSVDPTEIEHIALAEALFLRRYGASNAG